MSEKKRANALLQQCYNDYRIKLFNYCLSRLNGSRESADDCVQETFVVFYDKLLNGEGFEKTLEVRVIESLQTKKLSSVYALFPDSFDFTAEDLNNVSLDGMQVYAVYSDGSEKELTGEEYSVSTEYEKNLFEEYVTVTVSCDGCSCSFMVFKKG